MQNDPYGLDRLHDIVQPESVSWWPPAPFWYGVIAIGGVWLIYAMVLAGARWIQNAYRRQALKELAELSEPTALAASNSTASCFGHDPQRLAPPVQQVSSILKRVALVSFPRERVASLSGDAWLQFLDDTCDEVDFRTSAAKTIGAASYDHNATATDDRQWQQVVSTARAWIVNHRAEPIV